MPLMGVVEEYELILNIPRSPSLEQQTDSVMWHFDKHGKYSIKSGYWLSYFPNQASPSNKNSESKSWLQLLWGLKIPQKIKHFIWRLIHGWIPVAVNLKRHHVPIDEHCCRCAKGAENSIHALWLCDSLKKVRQACPFLKGICISHNTNILDLFMECKACLSAMDLEVLLIMFWRLWFVRNQFVMEKKLMQVKDVPNWSKFYWHELMSTVTSKIETKCNPSMSWVAPRLGLIKVNTDASLSSKHPKVGLGVILRDHHGAILASSSIPMNVKPPVATLEAMAILRGLHLARLLGLAAIEVASDAAGVIHDINTVPHSFSELGLVLYEIKTLAASFNFCSFCFSHRSTNRVAHELAHLAQNLSSETIWFGKVPSQLEPFVLEDFPS